MNEVMVTTSVLDLYNYCTDTPYRQKIELKLNLEIGFSLEDFNLAVYWLISPPDLFVCQIPCYIYDILFVES